MSDFSNITLRYPSLANLNSTSTVLATGAVDHDRSVQRGSSSPAQSGITAPPYGFLHLFRFGLDLKDAPHKHSN